MFNDIESSIVKIRKALPAIGDAAEQILSLLQEQEAPISRKEIFANVKGRKSTNAFALQLLFNLGSVEKRGQGRRRDPVMISLRRVASAENGQPTGAGGAQ
jgi:DNA-binding transcriptional ArsR family regulator